MFSNHDETSPSIAAVSSGIKRPNILVDLQRGLATGKPSMGQGPSHMKKVLRKNMYELIVVSKPCVCCFYNNADRKPFEFVPLSSVRGLTHVDVASSRDRCTILIYLRSFYSSGVDPSVFWVFEHPIISAGGVHPYLNTPRFFLRICAFYWGWGNSGETPSPIHWRPRLCSYTCGKGGDSPDGEKGRKARKHSRCKSAVEEFEVRRIQELEAKRDLRKSGPPDVSLTDWASCPQQVTLVMMRPIVSTAQSMTIHARDGNTH